MLDRRYESAEIRQVADQTWVLKIMYSYYSLFSFTETFVVNSLQDAKDKLILERTHGKLVIVNLDNVML